jgi:hypothetical protein
MSRKFATTFKPTYGGTDPSYAPWVLAHKNYRKLEPAVIKARFSEYCEWFDGEPEDMLDDFYNWLHNKHGYTIFRMWTAPILLEVPNE